MRNLNPSQKRRKKHALYRKQGGHCHYCYNIFPIHRLTLDHIIRQKDGGKHDLPNLVLACQPCNAYRELPIGASAAVIARWVERHQRYVMTYALESVRKCYQQSGDSAGFPIYSAMRMTQ